MPQTQPGDANISTIQGAHAVVTAVLARKVLG